MRVFFVLALGRSGTQFLSALLSSDPSGVVHHEPYGSDHRLIALRHAASFDRVLDGLLEQRFAELLPRDGGARFYGEVNSYLRYEVDWLRRRFDPALVHLVRDGRDFVRSAYIRDLYTPWQEDGPILPRDDDPYAVAWAGMTRFQRICWCWKHTNEFLGDRIPDFARFEGLLADYDYFARRILRPTGVEVSRETWSREVGRPRNTSRQFRLKRLARRWLVGRPQDRRVRGIPHWKQWDETMTRQFDEICGETMRRFGYGERGGPPGRD